MCGRMVLTRSAEEIVSEFELEEGETGFEWPPRYNVAPSQQIPIIRRAGRSTSELAQVRWGRYWRSRRVTQGSRGSGSQ